MYSSRKPNLLVNKAKHVFGAMKVEAAICNEKINLLSFCDIRLEASNLVAKKKQNMFSVRESVKSAVLLQNRENGCSQKDNAENSVT